jgi:hypothetical protein
LCTKKIKNVYLDAGFVLQTIKVCKEACQEDKPHNSRLQKRRIAQRATRKFVIVRWVVNNTTRANVLVILSRHTTPKDKANNEQDYSHVEKNIGEYSISKNVRKNGLLEKTCLKK